MTVDQNELLSLIHQFVDDLGATIAAGGIVIGHRLGLYRALAQGSATPEQLAERTGCSPRYPAEWLRGQAAGGYVDYEPASGTFALSEEQAFALADPEGPVYLPGAFVLALGPSEPNRTSRRRSGPVPGSAGMSRTTTCSTAANCSSVRATWPTWCRVGSLPWTGSRRNSGAGGGWPMSAPAKVRRLC